MCLAVPGKVVHVDGLSAQVDFGGIRREALIDLLPEVEVGDYILVHAGFAIQRLDPTEASDILSQLEEIDALGAEAEQT